MCNDRSLPTLQFLDRFDYLTDLITFSLPFGTLDIHSWVARPGCSVNAVAGSLLAWLPEVCIAQPGEIGEPDVIGILAKCLENYRDVRHIIYSINNDTINKRYFGKHQKLRGNSRTEQAGKHQKVWGNQAARGSASARLSLAFRPGTTARTSP